MERYLYILLLTCLCYSCQKKEEPVPSMVLEASIDAGGYPVVLIHKSYVLEGNTTIPDTSLTAIADQQLIPFGKVTISDGNKEEILTGRLDTFYMPPYSYSTLNMVGEVGKTYTISAKYNDMYVTARTTIPPVAAFDSVVLSYLTDSTKKITGYMSHISSSPVSYYAIFTRRYGEKQYRLSPLCVFGSGAATNGRIEVTVNNPDATVTKLKGIDHFRVDTTDLMIKIARIDEQSYKYWSGFSELAMTQGILFVPIYTNPQGNVKGGIGNFTGMGSSQYRISTVKDTAYIFN